MGDYGSFTNYTMKKIYFLLLFAFATNCIQAQTTRTVANSELLTPPVKINDLRFVVRKEKMTKFPVQSMLCDATKTSHLPFRY